MNAAAEILQEDKVKNRVRELVQDYSGVEVDDESSVEYASECVLELDRQIKVVEEFWAKPKAAARTAHKTICDKEKEMLGAMTDCRVAIKNKISVYLTAQEQERRRKEDEARKKAEAEAEHRRQALEEEAKAKEEQAAEAEGPEAEALAQAANDLRSIAQSPIVPEIVPPETGKMTRLAGGSVSSKIDHEITIVDPLALIVAIAEGKAPAEFVRTFANNKIKEFVKQNKLAEFPGLQIKEKISPAFRKRKHGKTKRSE